MGYEVRDVFPGVLFLKQRAAGQRRELSPKCVFVAKRSLGSFPHRSFRPNRKERLLVETLRLRFCGHLVHQFSKTDVDL